MYLTARSTSAEGVEEVIDSIRSRVSFGLGSPCWGVMCTSVRNLIWTLKILLHFGLCPSHHKRGGLIDFFKFALHKLAHIVDVVF